ncbi:GNAT family N-acetyltransferase [Muricoccus vinaceus]|uniref:GNAT family N-acetyltransferase n=1 Tax=Muricoccus vinaceus TaxID=424704 RepID=A0ABV6IVX2_9PROT
MQFDPRPATPNDLHAVEEIVRHAYSPYVSRIGREPGPMLDDYAALIAAGRLHVVERNGTVQGLVVLIPQHGAMLLDNVAVAPAAQGTGLGRTLLRYAERATRDAGYDRIELYTNEAMTENIALYARTGYSETRRVEEKGLKRVYMVKILP